MTPAADGRASPGRRAAGYRARTRARAAGRSPRCWSRSSTAIRCTRCGRRWPRTPRRPGCRTAGSGISPWPCTSWPPTRSAMAPGTGGCGSGRHDDALRCEVSDDGPGGVPASGAAGSQAADTVPWRTEYGHGLWLIRQVADQASVRSGPGGTVAVVSFALGPPGRLPPFRLARQARDGCTILAAAGPAGPGISRPARRHGRRAGPGGPRAAAGPGPVRPDRLGLRPGWPR